MVKAIPMEDWLRGCVYHDGRHGEVTLPTNEVLKIANYIQRTRQSTTDGLIDLEVVEVEHKTEPLKTTDYCVICKQDMCRDCIADATNPYCVPSHYEIKQTNNTGHKTEPQSEKEQTMRLIDADALIEVQIYDEEHEEWSVETMTVEECLARFADVPTIIETDRPHGKWIDYPDGNYFANCSLCGFQIDVHANRGYYNYCPNCGSDMRGEQTMNFERKIKRAKLAKTPRHCGMPMLYKESYKEWVCQKCGKVKGADFNEYDPPFCADCEGGESYEKCRKCKKRHEEEEQNGEEGDY